MQIIISCHRRPSCESFHPSLWWNSACPELHEASWAYSCVCVLALVDIADGRSIVNPSFMRLPDELLSTDSMSSCCHSRGTYAIYGSSHLMS